MYPHSNWLLFLFHDPSRKFKNCRKNCRDPQSFEEAKVLIFKEPLVLEGKNGGVIERSIIIDGKGQKVRFEFSNEIRRKNGSYGYTFSSLRLRENQDIEIKKGDKLNVVREEEILGSRSNLVSGMDKLFSLTCHATETELNELKTAIEADNKRYAEIIKKMDDNTKKKKRTCAVKNSLRDSFLGLGCHEESFERIWNDEKLGEQLKLEATKIYEERSIKQERYTEKKRGEVCSKKAIEQLFQIEQICDKVEVLPIKHENPAQDNNAPVAI